MTTHADLLVGRIALERGLVTREQLVDCLTEQAGPAAGGPTPLATLFLRRGFIRQPDLDSLLEEQKRRLAEAFDFSDAKLEDALLGRLLVRAGLATEKQVYECFRQQAEQSEQGRASSRLGELLVQKGFLTTDAMTRALALSPRLSLLCPKCGARYTLPPDASPANQSCKKCDTPLQRQADVPAGPALPVSEMPLPPEVAGAMLDPSKRFAGGRYWLIKELGRGGMGVVWKAWQTDLERFVAIKFMADGLLGDTELKRFVREAHTAASLAHPNIAPIYEVGAHDGRQFIAMQYVEGEPLSTIVFGSGQTARYGPGGVRLRHVPLVQALTAVRDAALAIDYAHSRGVIHRDLKPHNVMITRPDGRVYVMDFGLAKPVRNQDGISLGDSILGTPSYMSPEQARGEAVDHRTDIHGLGAILYFILTGRPPYMGQSPADTMLRVLTDDPALPRSINPSIHPDLESIAMQSLQKNRQQRYDSARSFADDLSRYLAGQPVRARTNTIRERTVRIIRKRPTLSVAVALSTAALILIVFAYRMAGYRDLEQVAQDVREASILMGKGDYPRANFLFGKALAIDPGNVDALAGAARCAEEDLSARMRVREWKRLADGAFANNQFAEALRYYRQVEVYEKDPVVAERILKCNEQLSRENAAIQELQKQVEQAQAILEQERLRRERRTRTGPLYAAARTAVESADRLRFKAGAEAEVVRTEQEALQLLNRCLGDEPAYAEAQFLRGQVRGRRGDFAGALEDFRAVHQRENGFAPAAFASAFAYFARYVQLSHAPFGSLDELAVTLLDPLGKMADHAARLSQDPFERAAAGVLGLIRARRFAAAAEALGRLPVERPARRATPLLLAALRLEEQDDEGALAQLNALLELDPMAAEGLYLRSILHSKRGAGQAAMADAARLVALSPDHALTYIARARASEIAGQKGAAATDLEKAAALDPGLAQALRRDIDRLKAP